MELKDLVKDYFYQIRELPPLVLKRVEEINKGWGRNLYTEELLQLWIQYKGTQETLKRGAAHVFLFAPKQAIKSETSFIIFTDQNNHEGKENDR